MGRGHQVTVFSGSTGVDIELNSKEIGLYKDEGLTMIVFNVPYEQQMSAGQKLRSYFKFSRMAGRQTRLLPKPDLLLVSTPPLSAAMPALKLKKEFAIPLVVEVRELWPDAPIQRGTLKNRLLIKGARNLEQKVYEGADRIIASGPGIAEAVKGRWVERAKVHTIPEGLDHEELMEEYQKVLGNLAAAKRVKIY